MIWGKEHAWRQPKCGRGDVPSAMSGLPPVPDLIPIALLQAPPGGGNGARRECAPGEVMGEQRSRRPGGQPAAAELIDNVRSRGSSAAPKAPPGRRASRRKSDRRREHRKPVRPRSSNKRCSPRSPCTPSSPERQPRVNPIFVWVRQEDTRIVDVKCEDYDKRNRILLTKTPQGWRAIPRTETLSLRDSAADTHHRHHHHRKSRKSKVRRRSAAVQVDSDIPEEEEEGGSSPTWTSPVNVESHLPSHKILVPNKCPSPPSHNVNSAVNYSAQTRDEKCSATKMSSCDVSPLDNLLAVAEFEFNQHMQSGKWDKTESQDDLKPYQQTEQEQKEFISNMEQLNSLIESCSKSEQNYEFDHDTKTEECDYTEDDDNNLAMDDILSRLEQSLQSPECPEITDILTPSSNFDSKTEEKEEQTLMSDINENKYKPVPEEFDTYMDPPNKNPTPSPPPPPTEVESTDDKPSQEVEEIEETTNPKTPDQTSNEIVESSTFNEDEPTDLSIKITTYEDNECNNSETEQPTDLTLPRHLPSPIASPRPPSQNSEAIQSPQPSGIPAVPQSPDIVTTSANIINNKPKSVFLESLLCAPKITINTEVTRQKEPLDLGKCRKSASPTVTCSSEEVKQQIEPSTKKFKPEDITLRNLLVEEAKREEVSKTKTKSPIPPETPRLLELLKTDSSEPDPLTQLRQILYDTNLNVPDPMLVPKERLSQIISHPGREIPRLLKQRPELRLPEALAFPHLLQDPDILVITLQQLETIILKQNQSLALNKDQKLSQFENKPKKQEFPKENPLKRKASDENTSFKIPEGQVKGGFNELASDIDAATTAAFNQMIWLPYLNQLEAMSFGNSPEMMKMLSVPMYAPDLNLSGRFPAPPLNFPLQQPPQMNYNSLELSMWQEAMMQANMLRPKAPFENPKNSFRDYLDKMNFAAIKPHHSHKMPNPINKTMVPNSFFSPPYPSLPQNLAGFTKTLPPYQCFNQKSVVQQKPHPYHHHKGHRGPNYHHKADLEKHKTKVLGKTMPNVPHHSFQQDGREKCDFSSKPYTQPIDLSGSTAPTTCKLKVKQHLIDPVAPKLLKHDEVPEVGSTTASVEEMQDAHKHLWHPLFGK